MHWKATRQVRGVKGCPPLFPPSAPEPEHHQNLNIQLQQWPEVNRLCQLNVEMLRGCVVLAPDRQEQEQEHLPSFPGKLGWISITSAKRHLEHHLRQWGKEIKKFSVSFALYRLKRKRLPREIIFTPLNTTRQIYILSLFDSKGVLLPYFFWNGNSIMCGWTFINYIPV